MNLRRKAGRPLDVSAAREILVDYRAWHVVVNNADAIVAALDLEARHHISFWNALIVHAAHVSGSSVLYSEDLSDGQVYDGVKVVNPLR